MSAVFFEELELPEPTYRLDLRTADPAAAGRATNRRRLCRLDAPPRSEHRTGTPAPHRRRDQLHAANVRVPGPPTHAPRARRAPDRARLERPAARAARLPRDARARR